MFYRRPVYTRHAKKWRFLVCFQQWWITARDTTLWYLPTVCVRRTAVLVRIVMLSPRFRIRLPARRKLDVLSTIIAVDYKSLIRKTRVRFRMNAHTWARYRHYTPRYLVYSFQRKLVTCFWNALYVCAYAPVWCRRVQCTGVIAAAARPENLCSRHTHT